MKTYLIVEEYCNDYEYSTRYRSFFLRLDAENEFGIIKASIESDLEDRGWDTEESETEFYMYEPGCYCTNHARVEFLEMETI